MSMQIIWACLMTMWAILNNLEAKGIHVSNEEEIALDKEYQQLQKPSIKIIQNEVGDVYDCVDFYKQSAFDHPLLKNHTFYPEMRPSSTPANKAFVCNVSDLIIKWKDGGCPTGTVPIRRVSKADYIRIKSFTQEYANSRTREPNPETHFAILQTNSDQGKTKYYGVGGILNVYNISVNPSQHSSGELIIQNGDDKIKVGWMVNPELYHDNYNHLFQYFDAGQSHCFNTLCPGFVNIRENLPIDCILNGASKRGGKQKVLGFLIFQDAKTGHWWLEVCGITAGFWPNQLFSTMSTSASYVAAGGEAYGPLDQPLPPMGNGYYPETDMSQSAYCSNFVVLDENLNHIDPPYTNTYCNDWHYGVYDGGIVKGHGQVVYYGGTTLRI